MLVSQSTAAHCEDMLILDRTVSHYGDGNNTQDNIPLWGYGDIATSRYGVMLILHSTATHCGDMLISQQLTVGIC